MRTAPNPNKMITRGMSHHFFSCRANWKNSLTNDHIERKRLENLDGLRQGKSAKRLDCSQLASVAAASDRQWTSGGARYSAVLPRSTAAASCAHSKRFARFDCG